MHEGDISAGFDETLIAEKSVAYMWEGAHRAVGDRDVHAYER